MRIRYWLLSLLFLTSILYAKGYSGGGGRSFSSGSSRSFSSSSPSRSYSSGSKPSSSYSSSKSSYSSSKSTPASSTSPSKPSKSFFSKADSSQAKAESQAKYESFKAEKTTKYKASAQSYDYLKSQPKEVYTTRPQRQQTVFHNYYTSPQPQPVYRDTSWNPFFWMWLLDHRDRQADWVYNHRSEISDERYKDLVAKNKDLEKQIKELEDKKSPKDPNYAPKEIDKDLMYSDDYVKDVKADDEKDSSWLWLIASPIIFGVIGWGIYAIFFKKRKW